MIENHCVDLMYIACNRLEFTQETFMNLLVNTAWQYVRKVFVYDDGSIDGTCEWLEKNIAFVPISNCYHKTNFGSPIAAMVHFIESAQAPILAKIDNDVMLPPDWLQQSLQVMERHPKLSLLGIEAIYPHNTEINTSRSYKPAVFISGLGLYRRVVFVNSRPVPIDKWFGFEQWQAAQGNNLIRGWINPALPIFLLDRIPFQPWQSYTDKYIQLGWQRSWPKYCQASSLWHWRWKDKSKSTPNFPSGDPRFLCAMRIKNEAKHIQEVITRVLPLCQQVFIFDDHSTDETERICRSFGNRITLFHSPFNGLDEARDKNFLLKEIVKLKPDWILWIDGDEVLELTGPEKLRRAVEKESRIAAFSLQISYLWNDAQHVRIDGIYQGFTRPSLFRLEGQPVNRLYFPKSGYGGNFHCGNVPLGLIGGVQQLNVRLKHYGYMTPDQRQAKYKWYTVIDPNNELEDNYRHIAEIRGAHFAPGPPKIVPWIE